MDVTTTALSGMKAAEKKLEIASNNIANQESKDYRAQDVVQLSQAAGGVRAEVVERNPATVEVAGDEGLETRPNVQTDVELANTQMVTYSFEANLKVLQRQREMDKSLLDIQA